MTKRPTKGKRKLGKRAKAWKDYEQVAAYVLTQIGKKFGLSEVLTKTRSPASLLEPDGKSTSGEFVKRMAH